MQDNSNHYNQYEYTLYNVNNGNFNPKTIDVDEF
jgi:hypothetical protein